MLVQAPLSLLPSVGLSWGMCGHRPARWRYTASLKGPGGDKLETQIGFLDELPGITYLTSLGLGPCC